MERLRLTTPSQQEGQHILVETDYAKLSKWLRSLPLADMTKALPEITRAISSLNRAEMSFKKRAELTELFDATYKRVHQYYRPVFSTNKKKQAREKLNRKELHNFTCEMAFAHKIIVNDCYGKRNIWGKNKTKIKAMAFSIFYLGLMLIEQYEEYNPIPIYLWREINSLFAHAGKEQIEHIKIETDDSLCLSTIEENYLRNGLIALSDPYHLSKGEHWQVFHYLQNWLHLAKISEDPDDFRKKDCFIIDVTSENKPSFVTSELDDPEDPKIRLLLTFDLIRQIKFDLESLQENNQLPSNSFHPSISLSSAKILWQHLGKHWSQVVERASRRYPIVTKVDIVWGINNICTVLAQSDKQKALPSSEISSLIKVERINQLTWNATNVSSGGIGLHSRQYMIPNISLGDLTLIREYMNDSPTVRWRLAFCCWHSGDKHNGTDIGLKYIEGEYTPVRLILYQGRNERGGQAGIVVSNTQVEGSRAATIIAALGTSQGDRVYAMIGYDKPIEVRPRAKVDRTQCVERFFYQTYELRDELAEKVQGEVIDVLPWTSIPHEKGNINDHFDTEDAAKAVTLDDLKLPGDH